MYANVHRKRRRRRRRSLRSTPQEKYGSNEKERETEYDGNKHSRKKKCVKTK